ncbi:type I secretion system permease/ATPase [Cognatazoarcus halotolerans]|uniref:type I secretion system permease/ATPase n=1 Tax=Cognatazoarcus halotolerans TaxID=2686016 RepID=UPI001356C459|nr:type I secretion system permease/ATPase [Cognatazoarcus halotolerans]
MSKSDLHHPLAKGYAQARSALIAVGVFSLCINLLMLTSPLYMLQIYDRVLVSRSVDTLLLLSVVALGALVILGVLETLRARVLVRVGARFDISISEAVFESVMKSGAGAQPLRDLETIRTFLTGRSLTALFDAPWTPLYIALVYVLHPWLGHVSLVGAVMLFVIALINESATRDILKKSTGQMMLANQFVEAGSRNAASIEAMGMVSGLSKVWHRWHDAGLAFNAVATDRGGAIGGVAKFVRITVQIAILSVGAFLAINEITTAGVMIAASIITGRALAPLESAISGWRSFLQARDARSRLYDHLEQYSGTDEPMALPPPSGRLVFENVFAAPPGVKKPVLAAISFDIQPGTTVGLTGPSAAGKSTLARLIVGAWKQLSGDIRLDGAEFSHWSKSLLGPHIGYLPQEVELLPGSVAQNIARFGQADADLVVDAAKLAGAHDTIQQLPNGYETMIGPGGVNLSGGQRQRIGLARAFYGRPALVVLDEPTSNLDAVGEFSVRAAIAELKANGHTVVVVAHRPSLVGGVDKMMVVQQGRLTHFGPTAEVMPQVTRRPTPLEPCTEVSL